MSITSEISRISGNVSDAFDAVDAMGGTVPSSANSGNLASAIRSIPQSGGGSGLPAVDSTDNGKVLTVVSGVWSAAEPEKDVFWIDALLDGQTFSVSNISCSCAEAEAAAADNRVVKLRIKYYTSPSTYEFMIGELRILQPYNSYNKLLFDTISLMYDPNGGGELVVVYNCVRFNSDDTMTYSSKLLNSTDIM